MIKECPVCHNDFEARANQKYCSPKCKKNNENSFRTLKSGRGKSGVVKIPSTRIKCPQDLRAVATKYWHKVAPILIKRGHLNVLSEDAFAELCDLYSSHRRRRVTLLRASS